MLNYSVTYSVMHIKKAELVFLTSPTIQEEQEYQNSLPARRLWPRRTWRRWSTPATGSISTPARFAANLCAIFLQGKCILSPTFLSGVGMSVRFVGESTGLWQATGLTSPQLIRRLWLNMI